MIELPAIRWGKPYTSLEVDEVKHFYTGEPVARVHTVGAGIIQRDAKKARNARKALQAMSPAELIEKLKAAGELFESGSVTVGDSQQSPQDFIQQQSATTGMPISMCESNVVKNAFVLKNIDTILDCLTRGLDLNILAR
ncbi:MAG: aldehyde dehydrogenase, partial [Planctomycetota bacterium]